MSSVHALVGVPYDNAMGREDAGAAIAFYWDGTRWLEKQKLIGPDPQANTSFGWSVAVSGDLAVVGSYKYDAYNGAAFVYRFSDGSWQLETTLRQPATEAGYGFGFAVDVTGERIVVTNPWRQVSTTKMGAAYVFDFTPTGWQYSATLLASDGAHLDTFGESVSLAPEGDLVVVGGSKDDDRGTDSGSAYVFRRGSSGSWTQEAKLTSSDGAAYDFFGVPVSATDSVVVVGARFADLGIGLVDAGAAYVFRRSPEGWRQEAKLVSSDRHAGEKFGAAVSMFQDFVVVGAPRAEDQSLAFPRTDQGAVYLFQYSGGSPPWQEITKIFAPDGYYYDTFGSSVDLSADWMIAGAPGDATGGFDSGSAYVMDVSCLSAAGCGDAGDCDDGNVCTTDTCSGGQCSSFANTDSCNDGNACTLTDRCSNGVCTGTPKNCDDGIACTVDSCSNGTCTYSFAACQCQTVTQCNDNNPCTTDTCVAGACVHTANTAFCNDNNACTLNDRCASGVCAGTPMVCNDNNPCTDDACVSGACRYTANTAPCNDNNACTLNDRCSSSVCAGTPMVCNDNIACTVDSCVNGTCSYNAAGCECRTHADCNDNNPCTNDLCSATFTCQRVNNVAPCNDGDACTTGDVCASGVCRGLPMACDDGNPCTADSCSNGACSHVATNAPCSDGDSCTTSDTCVSGVCRGAPMRCDDGRSCTSDFCLNGACVYDATGCQCTADADCNDNDPCTIDVCSSGLCFHGITLGCCGNGLCEAGEECECPADCGEFSAREAVGKTCTDGVDNDCDGLVDCEDPDCESDPACWNCDRDGVCELGEDCKNCPSDCAGESSSRRVRRFCCGNGVKEPGEANGAVCDGNF